MTKDFANRHKITVRLDKHDCDSILIISPRVKTKQKKLQQQETSWNVTLTRFTLFSVHL